MQGGGFQGLAKGLGKWVSDKVADNMGKLEAEQEKVRAACVGHSARVRLRMVTCNVIQTKKGWLIALVSATAKHVDRRVMTVAT